MTLESCAGRNRTTYLQVMSLASYRCSTAHLNIIIPRPGSKAPFFENPTKGAHDMLCPPKGADVTLPIELCGSWKL